MRQKKRLKKKYSELKQKQQEFEIEKEKLKKYEVQQKGLIKLNIGGTRFETSMETITKLSLFFQSMFCGRYDVKKRR